MVQPYLGRSEVLIAQSCSTLCDPMVCSPPGSSVHGIFQTRILEWVAIPSPRDLPNSGIKPASPALASSFFTTEPLEKPILSGVPAAAKSLQSCPTLCDPTDGSPPGSAIPGILQARTLEWVEMISLSSHRVIMRIK